MRAPGLQFVKRTPELSCQKNLGPSFFPNISENTDSRPLERRGRRPVKDSYKILASHLKGLSLSCHFCVSLPSHLAELRSLKPKHQDLTPNLPSRAPVPRLRPRITFQTRFKPISSPSSQRPPQPPDSGPLSSPPIKPGLTRPLRGETGLSSQSPPFCGDLSATLLDHPNHRGPGAAQLTPTPRR